MTLALFGFYDHPGGEKSGHFPLSEASTAALTYPPGILGSKYISASVGSFSSQVSR